VVKSRREEKRWAKGRLDGEGQYRCRSSIAGAKRGVLVKGEVQGEAEVA